METLASVDFNAESTPQKLGGGLNYSAVFSNAVFALKSCCEDRFRLLASVDIEIDGKIVTPAIAIYLPKPVDMASGQLMMTQLPVAVVEIDSLIRPFGELIAQVQTHLKAGVWSCWVIQPRMQCVFLFTAPQTYTFWQAPQKLIDPATGIELPLAPLFE